MTNNIDDIFAAKAKSTERLMSMVHGIIIAPEDWIAIDGQAAEYNIHPAQVISEYIRFASALIKSGQAEVKMESLTNDTEQQ